jgi:dCTP deaminase
MILSGLEIKERIKSGEIFISDFDEKRIGPNSCNLRLHNELLVYEDEILDMKKEHRTKTIVIPPEGLVLEPGKLYLGRTIERTKTTNFVPMLEGRSSIGRLGVFIHVTAGFGDIGFDGFWTLEIQCVQPVRIYPMVDIAQIYYHTIKGDFEPYSTTKTKSGKYQGNNGIQASMMYKDFIDED